MALGTEDRLAMTLDDLVAKNSRAKGGRRGPSQLNGRGGVIKGADRRQAPIRPRVGPQDGSSAGPRRGAARQPARTSRQQPKKEDDQMDAEDDLTDAKDSSEFIKVSAASNVKKVAGKLAHSAREGDPPAVLAIGADSLNQAIKAVAIARTYLLDDRADLTCQPAFRDQKRGASLALYIAKRKPMKFPTKDVEELTVGGSSEPSIVSGALAARVRENKAVCLTAIGGEAVSKTIRAICHARLYLEEDKVDIKALIEFIKVEKEGGDSLNAVRFNIIVEKTE